MRRTRIPVRSIVALAALAGVLVVGAIGCMLSVSIDQRVEFFFEDLNSARDQLYLNFQTDDPLDGDAIKDPLFWETDFPVGDGTPYVYSGLASGAPSNVTATVSGPPTFLGPKLIRFVMVQEGTDWFIRELYLDGVAIIPTP